MGRYEGHENCLSGSKCWCIYIFKKATDYTDYTEFERLNSLD